MSVVVCRVHACCAVRLAPRTTVATLTSIQQQVFCAWYVLARSALPPNHVVHLKCGRKNNKSGRMFNVSN
jgi:hypothetical protein